MFNGIKRDLQAVLERDPAAKTLLEAVLCYPGFHAIILHRIAHFLHHKGFILFPRLISHLSRFFTGLEIHPGAKIGEGVFIDHGMGVVIGETAEIGDNVTIYQGVTLEGTGKEKGKRHPTIHDHVIIGTGAKVLGNIQIGAGARIGAGSVILQPVPPGATVVGIPGRVVFHCSYRGREITPVDLEHTDLPDPITNMLSCLQTQIDELRQELANSKNNYQAQENKVAGQGYLSRP